MEDDTPEAYFGGQWSPICGHYFWDNHSGANIFCQKLGFESGVVAKKGLVLSKNALRVGKCKSNDDELFNCRTWECNDYVVGGYCSNNHHAKCYAGEPAGIKVKCKLPGIFMKILCVFRSEIDTFV